MIIQDLPGKSKMAAVFQAGFLIFAAGALLLSGCSSVAPRPERAATAPVAGKPPVKGGGYYLDDGPGDNPPANLDAIPDAEPRAEPLHKFANRPYTVLGQSFTPATQLGPYKKRGIASWYGRRYHGQKTAIGETYDMYAMTAAHPTLPIPSFARVTNTGNGKSVIVRVNDRGPFHSGRLIDLSYTAAYKLDVLSGGTNQVEVESLDPANGRLSTAPPRPQLPQAGALAASAPVTEEKIATTPDTTPPVSGSDGNVFLQLGAFSSRDNAENFSTRMRLSLGSMVEKLHIADGGGLFRVRLGPYASRSEAGQVATQISQAANISPVFAR
ncbi:MAG: septal ring lytic transglycosylase RlpA family protein [Sulfurimicrobium sp.]|nr:septal ring lytic transglycosylase RlpA family protein [Sulfurimicrobium sp.]MDP2198542.1 septal ring lytic transglycosylase RlpA family protein [Sulfurimicrobium sp.]MDP3687409.1 septal ring lytic transglycosylase RlpA family protein [Sulfurimicrobium sp.]